MTNTPPNEINSPNAKPDPASPIAASSANESSTSDSEGEPACTNPNQSPCDATHTDNELASGESPPVAGAFDVELVMHIDDINPPLTGWLDAQLCRVAAAAQIKQGIVTLAVVEDQEMASLHQEYKKVEGTTDVLTFDLREYDDDPIEGDIIICLDEAARQAAQRNHIVREELLLYAVHGLLHLQGYDDHDDEDFKQMHTRENELLKATGFAALFDQLD